MPPKGEIRRRHDNDSPDNCQDGNSQSRTKKARLTLGRSAGRGDTAGLTLAHELAHYDWRTPEVPTSEREKLQFQYEHFKEVFEPKNPKTPGFNIFESLRNYANNTQENMNDRIAGKQEDINSFKGEIKGSVNELFNSKDAGESKTDRVLIAIRVLKEAANNYRDKLSVAQHIAKKFDKLDQDWNESKETASSSSQADMPSSSRLDEGKEPVQHRDSDQGQSAEKTQDSDKLTYRGKIGTLDQVKNISRGDITRVIRETKEAKEEFNGLLQLIPRKSPPSQNNESFIREWDEKAHTGSERAQELMQFIINHVKAREAARLQPSFQISQFGS